MSVGEVQQGDWDVKMKAVEQKTKQFKGFKRRTKNLKVVQTEAYHWRWQKVQKPSQAFSISIADRLQSINCSFAPL